MKIKKIVRFRLSVTDEELMTIRAALDFTINKADQQTTENDIRMRSVILSKLRFET